MRYTLLLLVSILFLGCEQKECCVIPPIESQFHGKWELYRITNGFSQTVLTGGEIGFEEELDFNATVGYFVRKRDQKEVLGSKFQIGKEGDQDAVILIDDDTYQWYSFTELQGSEKLVLYEKCPIGAVLADGSYYEYRKLY